MVDPMIMVSRQSVSLSPLNNGRLAWPAIIFALITALSFPGTLRAQKDFDEIADITGQYQFLTAGDTLALLDEEGKIKGYIDQMQAEDESDAILSYPLTIGSRKKKHVEFKTAKIHQKYFRFTGAVERGSGHGEADPDYLRLVGDLEIITTKGESGDEVSQQMHVVFKSKGRDKEDEE